MFLLLNAYVDGLVPRFEQGIPQRHNEDQYQEQEPPWYDRAGMLPPVGMRVRGRQRLRRTRFGCRVAPSVVVAFCCQTLGQLNARRAAMSQVIHCFGGRVRFDASRGQTGTNLGVGMPCFQQSARMLDIRWQYFVNHTCYGLVTCHPPVSNNGKPMDKRIIAASGLARQVG